VEAFFDATIDITVGVIRPPHGGSSSAEKRGHRSSFAKVVRMEECLFASEKGPKVASGDLLGKDSSVTVGVMDQRCSDRGLESCLFGAANEGLGLQSGKLEKDEGFFLGSERDLGSLFGSERDDPQMPSLKDILLFVGSMGLLWIVRSWINMPMFSVWFRRSFVSR
jgi:hypothetical protein